MAAHKRRTKAEKRGLARKKAERRAKGKEFIRLRIREVRYEIREDILEQAAMRAASIWN